MIRKLYVDTIGMRKGREMELVLTNMFIEELIHWLFIVSWVYPGNETCHANNERPLV